MRIALAVLLFLHGAAHLVGFAVPFGMAGTEAQRSVTTIAGGTIDLGRGGMRLFGVAWLLLAIAFAAVALMIVNGAPTWRFAAALGIVAASTTMCVVALPLTSVGLALNVALLAWIVLGMDRGWFVALMT